MTRSLPPTPEVHYDANGESGPDGDHVRVLTWCRRRAVSPPIFCRARRVHARTAMQYAPPYTPRQHFTMCTKLEGSVKTAAVQMSTSHSGRCLPTSSRDSVAIVAQDGLAFAVVCLLLSSLPVARFISSIFQLLSVVLMVRKGFRLHEGLAREILEALFSSPRKAPQQQGRRQSVPAFLCRQTSCRPPLRRR